VLIRIQLVTLIDSNPSKIIGTTFLPALGMNLIDFQKKSTLKVKIMFGLSFEDLKIKSLESFLRSKLHGKINSLDLHIIYGFK
jgi:hypothetical protein